MPSQLYTKKYVCTPGQNKITDHALRYKRVIVVHRSGDEIDLIRLITFLGNGSQALGMQVYHAPYSGQLHFDPALPFNGSILDPTTLETVYVVYRDN
jgi:hypothetical protein